MEQDNNSSLTEKINDMQKYPIYNKIPNYKNIFREVCALNESKTTSNKSKNSKQKSEIQILHKQKESIKDLLELIKKNAIDNYTKNLQNKTIDNLKSEFINQLNDHKKHTENILNLNEKKIEEYILKNEKLTEENSKLKNKIENLNDINKYLNKELENNERLLNEVKIGYEKYKILFSKFEEHFPGKEPIEVIKEIEEIREGSVLLLQDKNDLILKIQGLKKDINIEKNNNLNYLKELQLKNASLEKNNEENINQNKDILLNLKEETKKVKILIENNKSLQSILYSIYNIK